MATNSAALIMSIISQIEASDFDRLYEIEQQAHLVPWSFGTLKNNQGDRYLNLKLIRLLVLLFAKQYWMKRLCLILLLSRLIKVMDWGNYC